MGPLTYKLWLPHTWRIHNVFHASLLSPYRTTAVHGLAYAEPPPDIVEGEEEYEVEAIIAHRGQANRRQYLVRWKGYSDAENTWLSKSALRNAADILSDYIALKKL